MSAPKIPVELRFQRRVVEDETGCWLWTGAVGKHGYGRISVNGADALAHRVSYEMFVGPIPAGLTIDHLCRVRRCVNPAHLEPCTRGENTMRGDTITARNARKEHCPRGHELSPRACGGRHCVTCRRMHAGWRGNPPNGAKTCCKHGHVFDEANTYVRPDGKGRECKACFARRAAERRAAKR